MPQAISVPIPFPAGNSPGARPNEGAGKIINLYSELIVGSQKPLWRRVPGLRYVNSSVLSLGKFRGALQVGSFVYAVFGTKLISISSSGNVIQIGGTAILGIEKVWMAANNAETPDLVIVAEGVAYWLNPTGPILELYPPTRFGVTNPAPPPPTIDLPNAINSPKCVCHHMGYLMFGYGDGRIRATKLNSTDLDSVDNTGTETNPDGVDALWSFGGQLFAAGKKTIEVFGDPINTTGGFPLTRVGYNITPGLMAPHAVSGWEAEFGRPPIYVGSDATIRQIRGYQPALISTHDIERDLEILANKSELEASVYVVNGHAFWQVSTKSWSQVIDTDSEQWHQRDSYLRPRSRIVLSFPAFNKWYAGDDLQTTAPIFVEIRADQSGETGNPLVCHLESAPVENFPNRIRVPRADFDITVGVGDAVHDIDPEIELPHDMREPAVEIAWSDDGGVFWSTPWLRPLGKQQNTTQRITVINAGMSGAVGRKWRLRIPNQVHVGILGGTQSSQMRIN